MQITTLFGLPSDADAQSALPTNPTAPAPFAPPKPKQLAKKFPQLEIIEITHKPPFFDYQVSYNLDKQYPGPSGRHSIHNRRSLPPEIQLF